MFGFTSLVSVSPPDTLRAASALSSAGAVFLPFTVSAFDPAPPTPLIH
jgi:hypothetical protein